MPADELDQLLREANPYFEAVDAYEARLRAAERAKPADIGPILAAAASDLKTATSHLQQSDLKADAAERLAHHDERASDILQTASGQAKRLNKPAPALEANDLDDKPVRLSDFRGHVVVLDFWYRGCGWCARQMPQMNQLADDLAHQPVGFLGISTDNDPADARFFAHTLGIRYPFVVAAKFAQQLGVDAYPTLILIDQKGTIRDIRVGYDPDLRQNLAAAIGKLLKEPNPSD